MTGPTSISTITTSALIAAASQTLKGNGYREISDHWTEWNSSSSRLFEDPYNIVGVVAYQTCSDLISGWSDQQGSLVNLISQYVGREEAKAWDGYLILLTPASSSPNDRVLDQIRYNTSRIRKLVATGDELRFASDVARVLSPLVPLVKPQIQLPNDSILELLPSLLGLESQSEAVSLLVHAFKEQAPLMDALHKSGKKQ